MFRDGPFTSFENTILHSFAHLPHQTPVADVVADGASQAFEGGVGFLEIQKLLASAEVRAAFMPRFTETVRSALADVERSLTTAAPSPDEPFDDHIIPEMFNKAAFNIEEGETVYDFITSFAAVRSGPNRRLTPQVPFGDFQAYLLSDKGLSVLFNAVLQAASNTAFAVYRRSLDKKTGESLFIHKLYRRIISYGSGDPAEITKTFVHNLFVLKMPFEKIISMGVAEGLDERLLQSAIVQSGQEEVEGEKSRYQRYLYAGCVDVADETPITELAERVSQIAARTSFLTFEDVNHMLEGPALIDILKDRVRALVDVYYRQTKTRHHPEPKMSDDKEQPSMKTFFKPEYRARSYATIAAGRGTVAIDMKSIYYECEDHGFSNDQVSDWLLEDEQVTSYAKALAEAMQLKCFDVFRRELGITHGVINPRDIHQSRAATVLRLRTLSHPQGPYVGIMELAHELRSQFQLKDAEIQQYMDALLGNHVAIAQESILTSTLVNACLVSKTS